MDYWDRLGWKDRFADGRFARRQRELANLARATVVYTPGGFLNLREFRGWRTEKDFTKAVSAINARPAGAAIRIELIPQPGGLSLHARFEIKSQLQGVAARPQAYVAVYENGLQTEVRAGENRDVTLRHDHVVRHWIGPLEFSGHIAELDRTIDFSPQWRRANLGIAAFVQDVASLNLLQATSMKVCG